MALGAAAAVGAAPAVAMALAPAPRARQQTATRISLEFFFRSDIRDLAGVAFTALTHESGWTLAPVPNRCPSRLATPASVADEVRPARPCPLGDQAGTARSARWWPTLRLTRCRALSTVLQSHSR